MNNSGPPIAPCPSRRRLTDGSSLALWGGAASKNDIDPQSGPCGSSRSRQFGDVSITTPHSMTSWERISICLRTGRSSDLNYTQILADPAALADRKLIGVGGSLFDHLSIDPAPERPHGAYTSTTCIMPSSS